MFGAPYQSQEEVLLSLLNEVKFDLTDQPGPPGLLNLLRKTVLAGGKRFRPQLLMLFGKLLNVPLESLVPYARAVEFTHAATLAHDDVIDESSERRSRKTANAMGSNARAILGGDYLLAAILAELSQVGELAVIRDLAQVLQQLVTGEWLQLESRGIVDVTQAHLETIALNKTASLIGLCCTIPARIAGLSEPTVGLFRRFGIEFGLAFQQMDDLLDFEEGTGKPVAQDFREGLVNSVVVKILEKYPDRRPQFEATLGKGEPWPWSDEELAAAMDVARAQIRERTLGIQALLEAIGEAVEKEGVELNVKVQLALFAFLASFAERKH